MKNTKHLFSSICMLVLWGGISSCNERPAESQDTLRTSITLSVPGADLGEPFLYTSQEGTTYLSWLEKTGTLNQLKYAVWEGETWSNATTIASGEDWFVNWADYPQISSFADGTLIAFFLEKSGEGTFSYDIKMTLSQDGENWSEPFTLHDDGTETEHGFVSMQPWKDQVFVSWLDGRNTGGGHHGGSHQHGHQGAMSLRGALINSDGTRTGEWELDTKVCDCCQTTAVLAADGPVVIFRDRSEDEVRDLGIVRFVADHWTETMPVYKDFWQVAGCPVNGPRADAMGDDLAVAWYAAANGKPEVKVVFSKDGGATFGKPVKIDLGRTIGRVDLSLLDKETAMVSWMEAGDIYVRKVHASGKTEPAVSIASSSEKRSSGFPKLSTNGNGMFMAWTDVQGENTSIQTMRIAF